MTSRESSPAGLGQLLGMDLAVSREQLTLHPGTGKSSSSPGGELGSTPGRDTGRAGR